MASFVVSSLEAVGCLEICSTRSDGLVYLLLVC